MICIIDYGLGNLRSLVKAFKKIGVSCIVSHKQEEIASADKLVLLGVGSFEEGMKNLNERGLVEVLQNEVIVSKKPILGICLGAQLFFDESEEAPGVKGLGFVRGKVTKFKFEPPQGLKVPHIGWNSVSGSDLENITLFSGIKENTNFYFVHSFHFAPNEEIAAVRTNYGYEFVSAFCKENIFGAQFHPEKSQKEGLKVLKNFEESKGGVNA